MIDLLLATYLNLTSLVSASDPLTRPNEFKANLNRCTFIALKGMEELGVKHTEIEIDGRRFVCGIGQTEENPQIEYHPDRRYEFVDTTRFSFSVRTQKNRWIVEITEGGGLFGNYPKDRAPVRSPIMGSKRCVFDVRINVEGQKPSSFVAAPFYLHARMLANAVDPEWFALLKAELDERPIALSEQQIVSWIAVATAHDFLGNNCEPARR